MSGKAKTVKICGITIGLGDYVDIRYTTGTAMKGGRIRGVISEIWSPKTDNHLQARVGKTADDKNGWCFHDWNSIEIHIPAGDSPNK